MQAHALSHRNRGRIRGRLEKNSTAEPVAEQKRKEKAKQRQAFFRYREKTCKKQYRGKVEKAKRVRIRNERQKRYTNGSRTILTNVLKRKLQQTALARIGMESTVL